MYETARSDHPADATVRRVLESIDHVRGIIRAETAAASEPTIRVEVNLAALLELGVGMVDGRFPFEPPTDAFQFSGAREAVGAICGCPVHHCLPPDGGGDPVVRVVARIDA
jgi:hypothetical protein